MGIFNIKKHQNELGLSLIEVIVSIVLLSIILISIFTMLTQSAKTTNNSEEIIQATYLAQTEMEIFYSYSNEKTFNEFESTFQSFICPTDTDSNNKCYTKNVPKTGTKLSLKKTIEKTNEIITIEIRDKGNTLKGVVIEVYEKEDFDKGNNPKAQMEDTLEWKDS